MTTTDQHPDLSGLLRGELTNAEVAEIGAHLDSCDTCRNDLAEVAVGHALLSGASRTLGQRDPVELPAVPALTAPPSRSQRWLRPVGLVAAAAALVAGSVGVTKFIDRPDAPDLVAQPVDQQTADLLPVEGAGGGRVVMANDHGTVQMTIETMDLPKVSAGQFYYVWLFNPTTNKMLALGVVGPGGVASFEVPDGLVDRYQVVDVSLERDDGDPAHSVTSVLRADYGSGDVVPS